MMLGGICKLVVGVVMSEVDLFDDPFLFQRFQCPIYRGLVGIRGERVNDVLSTHRILCFLEDIKNSQSGRRSLIAAFPKHLLEIVFLSHIPIISKCEILATDLTLILSLLCFSYENCFRWKRRIRQDDALRPFRKNINRISGVGDRRRFKHAPRLTFGLRGRLARREAHLASCGGEHDKEIPQGQERADQRGRPFQKNDAADCRFRFYLLGR